MGLDPVARSEAAVNPLDTLVALLLIMVGACGLWGCAGLAAKLWRYCKLTLRSLSWARRERGYMARWTRGST